MVKAEFEYHSELFESIKSKTDDLDRYGEVEAEKTLDSGKHPDIFIEGLRTHPIVFEVKRDDINPLNNDVVKQAREYAEELNTDIFVTCNSRSAFIFYQTGDEMGVHDYEYHSVYTDELETGKIVEQILQIVHKHYSEG